MRMARLKSGSSIRLAALSVLSLALLAPAVALARTTLVRPGAAWARTDGKVLDAPPSAAYGRAEWYPGTPNGTLSIGSLQGHEIASLSLRPVQYLPTEGKLRLISHFRIEVTVDPGYG